MTDLQTSDLNHITPAALFKARAACGLTRAQAAALPERAVHHKTVAAWERAATLPTSDLLQGYVSALTAEGVTFGPDAVTVRV